MIAKVLIVDDKKTNLMIADHLATEAGFETYCALSGKEAIELYTQEHPQLILMDLAMPVMDGFETASKIMALQEGEENKAEIIAMTAHIGQEYKDKCEEAGFAAFLEKPIKFDETLETLKRFLSHTT